MRLRKNLLISSIVTVLLTVPVLPYFYNDGFKVIFGYPIPYFTIFHLPLIRKNEILLGRIHINILTFLVDVVLVYILFVLVSFIINKLRNNKRLNMY